MDTMIIIGNGRKMFEITNTKHVPRLDEVVFYTGNKYKVVDITYDYDDKVIYIYTEML